MIKKILCSIGIVLLLISVCFNFYLYYNIPYFEFTVHYDLNQNYVDDDVEEGIIENIDSGKLKLTTGELEKLKLVYQEKYPSLYEQCLGRISCITQKLNKDFVDKSWF